MTVKECIRQGFLTVVVSNVVECRFIYDDGSKTVLVCDTLKDDCEFETVFECDTFKDDYNVGTVLECDTFKDGYNLIIVFEYSRF